MNLYEIITRHQSTLELYASLDKFCEWLLPEFKVVLSEHPLRHPSPGCCSVSETFWLYGLVRSLQPEVIIESGTFEGYSLYFLWRAARQGESRIYSFDPLNRPRYYLKNVEYYQTDWTTHGWNNLPGERTLIFFDDHIHHGKRLKQALRRHIRHVVFHDNYLTPFQSHVPLRYVNLLGLAKYCFTFERLTTDAIFRDTSSNPQTYTWLTYVELDGISACQRILRRLRYAMHDRNPYATW